MTTATITNTSLADALLSAREKHTQEAIKMYPQRVPRASSIGECDLEMLNQIRHWDKRPAHDAYLQQRFDRGSAIEKLAVRELNDIEGVEIIESQRSLDIKDRDGKVICTGHIDGKIRFNGIVAVFECKSLNPNIWGRINSIADFERFSWMKKYPRQILLYMFATGEEYGLFVIDDCLGHWKVLVIRLEDHMQECEEILTRCRRVVDANEKGIELPTINNPKICRDCWCFKAGLCFPKLDFSQDGMVVLDDTELSEALAVCHEHEDAAEEYAAAEKKVKESFKARGAGDYLVGETLVKVAVSPRATYDIPDDVKEKYRGIGKMTRVRWENIG